MTAKALAKKLDLDTPQELYNYLFESWFNGQFEQAGELFRSLNRDDKYEFLAYLFDYGNPSVQRFFTYQF